MFPLHTMLPKITFSADKSVRLVSSVYRDPLPEMQPRLVTLSRVS